MLLNVVNLLSDSDSGSARIIDHSSNASYERCGLPQIFPVLLFFCAPSACYVVKADWLGVLVGRV